MCYASALEAQLELALQEALAESKRSSEALSESQAMLARLQDENAKMLAGSAEALAEMTSKFESAAHLADLEKGMCDQEWVTSLDTLVHTRFWGCRFSWDSADVPVRGALAQ